MLVKESIQFWFEELSLQGEYTSMWGEQYCLETGRVIVHEYPHSKHDGIGAFLDVLLSSQNDIPKIKIPKREIPNRFYQFLFFLKYLKTIPFRSVGWKIQKSPFAFGKKASIPPSRAGDYLSKVDTIQLEKNALKAGVHLNTFVLYHLDRAFNQYYKNTKRYRYWLIPVSLRTNFKDDLDANITGFVDAKISEKISITQLNNQIKNSLKSGIALGGYFGITIGQYIPKFLLRLIIKSNHYAQVRTGVFSNLGKWGDPNGVSKNKWIGWPPVIRSQPIGALTAQWFGQQSLSVIIHPTLSTDPKFAEEIMSIWKKNLLKN